MNGKYDVYIYCSKSFRDAVLPYEYRFSSCRALLSGEVVLRQADHVTIARVVCKSGSADRACCVLFPDNRYQVSVVSVNRPGALRDHEGPTLFMYGTDNEFSRQNVLSFGITTTLFFGVFDTYIDM